MNATLSAGTVKRLKKIQPSTLPLSSATQPSKSFAGVVAMSLATKSAMIWPSASPSDVENTALKRLMISADLDSVNSENFIQSYPSMPLSTDTWALQSLMGLRRRLKQRESLTGETIRP